MRYIVRIVQPLSNPHWQCFREVASGLSYAINQLGHECTLDIDRKADIYSGRLIIFNSHSLPENADIPYDAVLFNAEQVQIEGELGDNWKSSPYLKSMKQHIVWDYSKTNAERLGTLGVPLVVSCRVGYWPGLSDIIPADIQDIDVLFIGCLNERRAKVLYDIGAKKLRVHVLSNLYGAERNSWIARSKIVLNTHYYPNPIFEVFRASHLLANKKCIVTEDGGQDPVLEKLAQNTCAYATYDTIADTCVNLIADGSWKTVGDKGFDVFSRINQVEQVKIALEASL